METENGTSNMRGNFVDRSDAGRRLAKALTRYQDRAPIVLALPRGGVPVGFEIARALGAPLEVMFVRRLGAPGYPELGVGAVVDGTRPQVILNSHIVDSLGITIDYLESEVRRQLDVIEARKRLYRGALLPTTLERRTIILTDDGIATGGSARAALRALARVDAAHTVLAMPVAPQLVWEELIGIADDAVCLHLQSDFRSVGAYYNDFTEVSDQDVVTLLSRVNGTRQ